jgi:ATP-binding cassette subfamily B protein
MEAPAGRRDRALMRRALEFVTPFKSAIGAIVALALVLAVTNAIDPLVMKYLFDALGRSTGRGELGRALLAFIGIEITRATLTGVLAARTWRVRLRIDYALRERLITKLHALPISYHQEAGIGGTVNKVNQSVQSCVLAFSEIAFNVVPTVVYLGISVLAMWRLEWRLAAMVVLFAPLPAVIGGWAARRQTARERVLMAKWTRLYGRLNEVLANIRLVKVFGMEQAETRRFLGGQKAGNEIVLRGVAFDATTAALQGFAATLARIAAIAFGGWLVIRGQITLGTLVAFLSYIAGLFGPVQGLTGIYQKLRMATVGLETIVELLDADEVVGDLPGAAPLPRVRGEIRFRRVEFGYRAGTPVLAGLDLHVRPGETVALVGPSGSGKTTIVSLLQRLHAVTSGAIEVDGVDIRTITGESLRQNIAVVFQESLLFNDTIRANIRYGRADATDDDVEAAARVAHAHEFIAQLPDGYDTVIGEAGGRLSGGQRQRLAIARAVIREAPILILDEATSALDADSETVVQGALDVLRRDRTTIVIAHRLSTVVNADRIVVLRDGRAVAIGRHEELLRESQFYAQLVERSTNGLLTAA